MNVLEVVNRLGRATPIPGWQEAALETALETTGSKLEGQSLTALATSLLCLACLTTFGMVVTLGGRPLPIAILWLVTTCGVALLLLGPRLAATARTARALGGVPDIIGLAVLRMHLTPTAERAATFAATHTDGPLSKSLAEHVRRTRGGAGAGWRGLVEAWSDRVPELGRSVSLLEAGTETTGAERRRLLEGAHQAALEGTQERMARFAVGLHGPTTAVYAFGVVLPLALIGALPTARAAGVSVSLSVIVFVYDFVLPAALLTATVWLVSARPVAFPAPAIPSDHPELPDRLLDCCLAVIAGGGASLLLARETVPTWGVWVITPGAVIGTALVIWYRPVVSVRNRTTAVEAGLPDVLTVLGGHLQRGNAPETALADAGNRVHGPAGEAFSRAASVQQRMGVGIEAALVGDHGAITARQSPRLRVAVAVLVVAAKQGKSGGAVLVTLADHLDDLMDIERTTRRKLATIVATLRNTARFFGPLIAGTTVALAVRLDGASLGGTGSAISGAALGTAIGVYVLLLAAILAALATGLDHGGDRARIGAAIGWALLSASVVYPLSVAGVSLLL